MRPPCSMQLCLKKYIHLKRFGERNVQRHIPDLKKWGLSTSWATYFITSELNNFHLLVGIIKEMGLSVYIKVTWSPLKKNNNNPFQSLTFATKITMHLLTKFYGRTHAFILKTRSNFLIFRPPHCRLHWTHTRRSRRSGPWIGGRVGAISSVYSPPHHHHHPPLARSPFCGNFSIGFTSEKAHSWSLNDHPSLLRETRQGTHASSALSSSVGKWSY